MCVRLRVTALGVMLVAAPTAQAQSVMTLADVLARARAQAPQITSARLALEEVRGRLLGASLRAQANPEVDMQMGGRSTSGGRRTDFELGVTQALEPGSRRTARLAGANAALDQGAVNIEDATRTVLHQAARAFFRAVHAGERMQLLDTAQRVAQDVFAVADRRFRAGDIAVLDVNLARASLARVRAEREATEARREAAIGDLKSLLGIETVVAVRGDLAAPPARDLARDLAAALTRPDLRAIEASVREAEADAAVGRSLARPDYGVGVRYAQESGDRILLGGLTVSLPVFSRGQDVHAVGSARAARLRAGLDAARTQVQIEVRTAFNAYQRRMAAVRILEADVLPGLDENEALTTRSFDVGQLGLTDLLVIRGEILNSRFQYLDARLEAALAGVDLDASAGVLQ